MEPPLLCWISYLQVLPQWKLSQSLPQLPKVRVQEDRLILQTTRNEGDWYKHWAWHCVYCMCTWELFVQNLDNVMCILVHICVLQWLLLQQAKLISLFYNALILYLTSREMQCSYFTPLSVYHFMHGYIWWLLTMSLCLWTTMNVSWSLYPCTQCCSNTCKSQAARECMTW